MRAFALVTTLVLAQGLGHARAEDPKPSEKPPALKPEERGYLGFAPEAVPLLTGGTREGLRITTMFGVVVTSVTANGPAAKAGLKPGDFLVKINGEEMPDTSTLDPMDAMSFKRFQDAFAKIVGGIKPGAEVELLIKRAGEEKTIKATAIDKATREKIEKENKEGPAKPKDPPATPATDHGYAGFEARAVSSLSDKQKKRWRVKAEAGVVAVRVLKDSPAEKAGLANGDVLVKYAGAALPTAKELAEAKDAGELVTSTFAKIEASVKPGADVEIVVERDGKPVTLKAVAVDKQAIDKIEAASGEPDDDE